MQILLQSCPLVLVAGDSKKNTDGDIEFLSRSLNSGCNANFSIFNYEAVR
jgi:hypothetical protein